MAGSRIRPLVPFRGALRALAACTAFSDVRSLRTYFGVLGTAGAPGALATVRVRQLGGRPVSIRTRGTDARVVFATFVHQYHLPPPGAIRRRNPAILDLGANIGCTMAHFASLYSGARVVGVEMDGENARLCRANVAPWRDRCEVINAAVWPEDGVLVYDRREDCYDGYSVAPSYATGAGITEVPSVSMNTLVAALGPDEVVDYAKVDVEGSEAHILKRNTQWAERVGSLKVEVHGKYSRDECVADLERLGYRAECDAHHALGVVAVRRL